ncbi:MAG TPA: XRE family transcriptional regulator [Planctomycetota bacterium]|nr:XRE family transcriptional regulator [Planctomycetota bacterium]
MARAALKTMLDPAATGAPVPLRIGAVVQRVRLERGLRLEDLAKRAGFTKGFLSKIENGKANPPIATLLRVAGALGVDPSLFFDGAGMAAGATGGSASAGTNYDPHASAHVPATSRLRITNASAGPGYDYWSLAAPRRRKAMEPFLLTVRPGQVDRRKRFEHPGEEFIHVLAGRMEYVVGNERYKLEPGDSLYFEASRPHAPWPIGGPVTFLAVFYTPPRRLTAPESIAVAAPQLQPVRKRRKP